MANLALYPDATVVMFDDLLANRQSQSRTLGFTGMTVADLMKFLENQLVFTRGDARAIVADLDPPAIRRGRQAAAALAGLFRAEFHGV